MTSKNKALCLVAAFLGAAVAGTAYADDPPNDSLGAMASYSQWCAINDPNFLIAGCRALAAGKRGMPKWLLNGHILDMDPDAVRRSDRR
jgi:hypothetical protein